MSVEQRTFRVTAIGSTDAAEQGKRAARLAGFHVRTLSRIELVTTGMSLHALRHERAEWDVTVAVVVPG